LFNLVRVTFVNDLDALHFLQTECVLKSGFITKQPLLSMNYYEECLPENKTFA
jgi:hypothetical protein